VFVVVNRINFLFSVGLFFFSFVLTLFLMNRFLVQISFIKGALTTQGKSSSLRFC